MNPTLVIGIGSIAYVIIGVATVVRSFRLLKQVNPSLTSIPVVMGVLGTVQTLIWPVAVICEPIVLRQVAPHLLPTKKVKPLERIAISMETMAENLDIIHTRLLNSIEAKNEHIDVLEQQVADLRYNYDAVREERDEANRALAKRTEDVAELASALNDAREEANQMTAKLVAQRLIS